MTQGLQLFDASGNMLLDVADSLTRILGVFDTGYSSGSIVDSNLLTGTPWYTTVLTIKVSASSLSAIEVIISGSTLTWVISYPYGTAGGIANTFEIMYGVS